MKIKYAFMMLAFAGLLWSCGSGGNSEQAATEAPETTEESTQEVAAEEGSEDVLNPNLASKEQLMTVAGLNEAQVDQIIAGRPHLNGAVFAKWIKDMVSEEDYEATASRVFLPMNLNTTDEDDFKLVPGVGNKMAHEFEEYRPYTSVEQFRREIGKYVDEAQVLDYEQFVFVPLNLNTTPEEQFKMIPGVGDKMAHEFEEYRPYSSMEQFRREIGKYVDENEVARLERFVTLGE
ncbi:MAG: helix-hairpin-helix domain-containing protein [Cytophagales bacterium]|nr:helix-hairpin-helix domain-containing protein [Cytophagales bacterium]